MLRPSQWRTAVLTCYVLSMAMPAWCIERLVEFRDGSHLRIGLPPLEFKLKTGNHEDTASQNNFLLAETSQITFSEIPPFRRLDRIKVALQALRDENFAIREAAALTLTKFGSGFRELLQGKLDQSFDPEIRWRLRRVIEHLPINSRDEFDHVRLQNKLMRGEFEPWHITAKYRGTNITLNRSTVSSIRVSSRTNEQTSHVHTVRSPDSGLIPLACRKIDFERTPAGNILRAGENIQDTFINWGLTLSTSVKTSFVSVNRYDIEGAGGGKAAATHDPLYEGAITIRFCVPGHPSRKSAVSFIGCWLGIVKPGGTSIVAYDANGSEIGRAVSGEGDSQFLGVKSNVPIARVEIVPNPQIDSNFALDDLIYDTPTPLMDALNPSHFSITLRDGNRLNCHEITPQELSKPGEETILAKPGVPFAEVIPLPLEDISILIPPPGNRQAPDPEKNKIWALLRDGSRICLLAPEGRELMTLIGDLPARKLKLSSIWTTPSKLKNPPADLAIPSRGAAIIIRNDPLYLNSFTLGEDKFSGIRPDGSTVNYSYNRLPIIWIEKPVKLPAPNGKIELTDGQAISFGDQCLFNSCTIQDNGITMKYRAAGSLNPQGNKSIHLGFQYIQSVQFY